MDNKSKKEYIKKTWRVSSGKRLSEMLRRYWQIKPKKVATSEDAERIFNEK